MYCIEIYDIDRESKYRDHADRRGYSPEVHRLEADGRIHHALEPALLLTFAAGGGALETTSGRAGELTPEGRARALVEDGPGSAEHGRRGRHCIRMCIRDGAFGMDRIG